MIRTIAAFVASTVLVLSGVAANAAGCNVKWMQSGRPDDYRGFMERCLASDTSTSKQQTNPIAAADVWNTSGQATWDSKRGGWIDGSNNLRPPTPRANTDMSTEAGIRAQADRIFPWVSQSEQRELWIADKLLEQLDRERGSHVSVRVGR